MKNKKTEIVHTSDFHLKLKDNKIQGQNEFSKIINFCIKRKVKALLIAGDLFDSPKPKKEVIEFVKKELARLSNKDIATFIISGNNDPSVKGSVWQKTKFPKLIFVFKKNKLHQLRYDNLIVYGLAYTNDNLEPLKDFRAKDSDQIKIALVHGTVVESKDKIKKGMKRPITIDQINKSDLDYLALGHFHSLTKIKSRMLCVYSGTPLNNLNHSSRNPGFCVVDF